MKIKGAQAYGNTLESLGFRVEYTSKDLPDAYCKGMSIEALSDFYSSPTLRIRISNTDGSTDLEKFKEAFQAAMDFMNQNRMSPKQKIQYLFDGNKVGLGNILETESGIYTVGHISTGVPKLTITSVNSGDVVAMGQSFSELGNNFCDYFAKHRKDIPMVSIWNSFNEYLDQH